MRRALVAAALALLPAATGAAPDSGTRGQAEPKLPELKLTYAATWNGISLGNVIITLKGEGGPDCYRYESISDPVGMVRMFYGKPHETSDFCVRDGKVVPKRFSFVNPSDEKRSFTLEFDAQARKVRDSKGGEREIPANAQDRFGLQQAVRLWVLSHPDARETGESVEFAMVDDRRIKTYRFAMTARETIEVPAGRFETIVMQRVDDPKKSSKFWLAPERDFMPVKVEQLRGGKADLRMVLR